MNHFQQWCKKNACEITSLFFTLGTLNYSRQSVAAAAGPCVAVDFEPSVWRRSVPLFYSCCDHQGGNHFIALNKPSGTQNVCYRPKDTPDQIKKNILPTSLHFYKYSTWHFINWATTVCRLFPFIAVMLRECGVEDMRQETEMRATSRKQG